MITTYAAAAAHEQGGWAGIIAIVVPLLIAWAGTTAYKRWKSIQDGTYSPAKIPKAIGTVKPQLKGGSDSDVEPPQPGGGEVVPMRPTKAVEDFVAERIGTMPTTAIVREAVNKLKVSEATVWRSIREQRASNGAA